VYGGFEDAEALLEGDYAPRIEKDSDGREIIYDPITVMYTGVPRPGRDDKYVARLDREVRVPKSEAAYAEHIRAHSAAAREPEPYKPPPMSKAPEELPELAWRGVWVQIRGPDHERNDPGEIAEARYAVLNGVLYVEDTQGRRLGVQELGAGEDAAAVARGIARKKLGGEKFFAPIAYPNLGLV
jgi:hypothetical protein